VRLFFERDGFQVVFQTTHVEAHKAGTGLDSVIYKELQKAHEGIHRHLTAAGLPQGEHGLTHEPIDFVGERNGSHPVRHALAGGAVGQEPSGGGD
jgi:hypothetical protein